MASQGEAGPVLQGPPPHRLTVVLSHDQLVAAVADLSWYPGWNLTVHHTEHEGSVLRITATVPNSYSPDETVDLGVDSHIPPVDTIVELHRWVDGKALFDPHQPTT